ncbi:PIN domain-containing protein [Ornithinimicrobium sp. Y1847]|uniref:PIN domain-containing protein n=1 Tax=unclassified Ornithinimicrobium TaxID=2615080 RepID=UPI003B67FA5F
MSAPQYLLETSTAIDVLRGRRPDLRQSFNAHAGSLVTSSIVVSELLFGALRSSEPRRLRDHVEQMLGLLPVLDFDEAAAIHAADIRAELASEGSPIGAYDTLIAGHARSRGLVVITENGRDFGRVGGLRWNSWRADS